MKISELIAKLQDMQREHGDIDVIVRNAAGDLDEARGLATQPGFPHPGKVQVMEVRIDTYT